jgi:hypothetical protein
VDCSVRIWLMRSGIRECFALEPRCDAHNGGRESRSAGIELDECNDSESAAASDCDGPFNWAVGF